MKRIAGGAKPPKGLILYPDQVDQLPPPEIDIEGHPMLIAPGEKAFPLCRSCNGKGCETCLQTGWGKLGPKALRAALAKANASKPETPPAPTLPTGQLTFGW